MVVHVARGGMQFAKNDPAPIQHLPLVITLNHCHFFLSCNIISFFTPTITKKFCDKKKFKSWRQRLDFILSLYSVLEINSYQMIIYTTSRLLERETRCSENK